MPEQKYWMVLLFDHTAGAILAASFDEKAVLEGKRLHFGNAPTVSAPGLFQWEGTFKETHNPAILETEGTYTSMTVQEFMNATSE